MKKNIMIGICSLLFYYFVCHLMLLWEYDEKYAVIQEILLYILPSLPGIALAFLLIQNSLNDFLKTWWTTFLSSFCLCLVWALLRMDLVIYTGLTGAEEFGLGDSLLMVVMSLSYIVSCTLGCTIAGVVSFCKQKKSRSVDCYNNPF